jgi:hypothetical protein
MSETPHNRAPLGDDDPLAVAPKVLADAWAGVVLLGVVAILAAEVMSHTPSVNVFWYGVVMLLGLAVLALGLDRLRKAASGAKPLQSRRLT